jgi:hypothetical protein
MFNPLAPLDEKALESMVAEGYRYFVGQSFHRARDLFEGGAKDHCLFCHYKEWTVAKEHFDAVKHDPNKALYDWEKEGDKKTLLAAARGAELYNAYTNTFLPDWENHITDRIKHKIRAYITKQGWKGSREEGVHISFYPHFGEVMVTLRFRRQEVKVKFEEIEKIA